MKKVLMVSDLAAAMLAFLLAYYLRDKGVLRLFLDQVQPLYVYLFVLPVALLLLIFTLEHFALYKTTIRVTALSEIYKLFQAVGFWLLLLMSGSYLMKYDYSRLILLLYVCLTFLCIVMGRLALRQLVRKGWRQTHIVIVGRGDLARRMARKLRDFRDLGYELVGQYSYRRQHVLLSRAIRKKNVNELWLVENTLSPEEILAYLASIKSSKLNVRIYSDMFGQVTGQVSLDNFDGFPMLQLAKAKLSPWQRRVKRTVDVVLGLVIFLLTIPLWLVMALAIRIDSPGPVLFRQKRIGFKGKAFFLYKFRTMKVRVKKEAHPPKKADDLRITRVGKILRRTSLDELPQLLNVLRGEMSLVGPRPEMPFIVAGYKAWQRRRLVVQPGLTGLWQIVGRKDLPLSEHLEYDFYYINNQSILFDLAILLKTVIYVILGRGAY